MEPSEALATNRPVTEAKIGLSTKAKQRRMKLLAALLDLRICGLQSMEIVHFTDLHFENANPFQRDLIQALIRDLAIERSGGLSPDFLLFSGDLVHNPDDPDIYPALEQEVMTPLLRVLGLTPNRVILCPGNHDVSHERMKQHELTYDALHNQGLRHGYLAKHRTSVDFNSYCRHISEGSFSVSNHFGKELDHILAQYRTYYVDRQVFNVGTNVEKDGKFYKTDNARKCFFSTSPTMPNNDIVRDWLVQSCNSIITQFDETMTGGSLLQTFIDPVIDRPKQSEDEDTDSAFEKTFTVSNILESNRHIVIACDHEYGGTSLLRYLCIQFYAKCTEIPRLNEFPIVAAMFDARRLRHYPARISRAIKGSLPESSDPSLKLQSLHEGGRLVLLVDDFDPADAAHANSLEALKSEFPKARLIIAAKLARFIAEDYTRPNINIDKFIFLQVKPFNRRRVRHLVEKWQLPAYYQTDSVVEELNVRFRALGIPLTPVYVVIYLSCLKGVRGYTPINSSTIIEQFVELVLEKYKPIYAFRSAFDYKNQIDYLSAIAEYMCR
jgi:hypothetical protein